MLSEHKAALDNLAALNRQSARGVAESPSVPVEWAEPDMAITQEHRRPAPDLPLEIFGPFWKDWISKTAKGVSSPVDYVAGSLMASVAALLGNARWGSPWPQWSEPTILWLGVVGRPSSGKSPGIAGPLEIVRKLEATLGRDYPAQKLEWQKRVEEAKAEREKWQGEVKEAVKAGRPAPDMPTKAVAPDELLRPRIRLSDTTPEALGKLLSAHPRGLLFTRDELAGWLESFGRYSNGGDRAMWIECFNGRDYVIDRVKTGSEPIRISNMTVSMLGGIQPDRLQSSLLSDDDDGLAARFLFIWPAPVAIHRPKETADHGAAESALRRILELPIHRDDEGNPLPLRVPFSASAADLFDGWRKEHAKGEEAIHGLYLSHWGKLPGLLIRLATVLEYLWWSPAGGSEPAEISEAAFAAAACLIEDYFKPMAERTYGDVAMPQVDQDAATIAKWIAKNTQSTINARTLQRVGPAGLRDKDRIRAAINALVDAGWLRAKFERAGATPGRTRVDYEINPAITGGSR